jgi:hypothetical protein
MKILCIALVAAGPWLGPVWAEAHTSPIQAGETRISACVVEEAHAFATSRATDVRPVEVASCVAAGEIAEPPVRFPEWEQGRAALPHPTRVFLITLHSSSFL